MLLFYAKSTGQYLPEAFLSSSSPTLFSAFATNSEQKQPLSLSSLIFSQLKSLSIFSSFIAPKSYFFPRFFFMNVRRVVCASAFRIQLSFLSVTLPYRSKQVIYCFQSQMDTPCIWLHSNTIRSFFFSRTTMATWSKSELVKKRWTLAPKFQVQKRRTSPVSAVRRNSRSVRVSLLSQVNLFMVFSIILFSLLWKARTCESTALHQHSSL